MNKRTITKRGIVLQQMFWALLMAVMPCVLVFLAMLITIIGVEVSDDFLRSLFGTLGVSIVIVLIIILIIMIFEAKKMLSFIKKQESLLSFDFDEEMKQHQITKIGSPNKIWYIHRWKGWMRAEVLVLHADYIKSVSRMRFTRAVDYMRGFPIEIWGVRVIYTDGYSCTFEGQHKHVSNLTAWLVNAAGFAKEKSEPNFEGYRMQTFED